MNETDKAFKVSDHLIGLILLITVFSFIIFIFLKQNNEVVKKKDISINEQELQEQAQKKYKSETYATFLAELEKIKQEGKLTSEKENKFAAETAEKIIKESLFERSNKKVLILNHNYSKSKYQENIDDAMNKAKKIGMGKEMEIFILQAQSKHLNIEDKNQSLILSDLDKEELFKAAEGYTYFAQMVEKMITPTDYLDVANLLMNNSYDIGVVLKKIAVEEDPLINTVWFVRYTELVKIFYQ